MIYWGVFKHSNKKPSPILSNHPSQRMMSPSKVCPKEMNLRSHLEMKCFDAAVKKMAARNVHFRTSPMHLTIKFPSLCRGMIASWF
jgi:hypothetical protein